MGFVGSGTFSTIVLIFPNFPTASILCTFLVVSVSATNRHVFFLPEVDSVGNYNAFTSSHTLHSNSTGSSMASKGGVDSVSTAYPEIQRNSGDILYLENRGAVARAADQIEDIKLIIEM